MAIKEQSIVLKTSPNKKPINGLVQKYLPFLIVAGVVLGIGIPDVALSLKPFVLPCLSILIFFPALKIDVRKVTGMLSHQINILIIAILVLFGLIPLLIYSIGYFVGLQKELLVGLVLASSAPSMLSASYFTNLIQGDIETSFSISIVSTLLSPLLVPLVLYLLIGENASIDPLAVGKIILYVVLVPLLSAALLRFKFPAVVTFLLQVEHYFTIIAIALPNWVMIGANRDPIIGSVVPILLPIFLIGVIQVFGVFFLTRKLSTLFFSNDVSKALAVSFGLKNVALVGGVIITFNDTLAIPAGILTLTHVVLYVIISSWQGKL